MPTCRVQGSGSGFTGQGFEGHTHLQPCRVQRERGSGVQGSEGGEVRGAGFRGRRGQGCRGQREAGSGVQGLRCMVVYAATCAHPSYTRTCMYTCTHIHARTRVHMHTHACSTHAHAAQQ